MGSSTEKNRKCQIPFRDPLTGAFSRVLLQERLREEIKQAQESETVFSLLVIDLDYFKSINDAYGHNRGDQVLQEFSERVQALIRDTDILFRFGGDEFAILLPDTGKKQALMIANRILESFKAVPLAGKPPITLSLSIGIADFPDDGNTPEALFRTADRRTYEAKYRGRGRIVEKIFLAEKDLDFVRLPRLLEREKPIRRFRSFLEHLPEKNRGVLCVIGPSGIGRTALLLESANIARMLNYEVIVFKALRELKGQAYGVMLTGDSECPLPPGGEVESFREIILQRINKNGCKGIIIFLDNLPHLDHATLNLLRQLIMDTGIFCLGLVYSTDPDSTRVLNHPDQSLNEIIQLEPLSREGLRIWIRNTLQWEPPLHFLEWLHRQTKGFPRLIQESLAILVEQEILRQNAEHGWQLHGDYAGFSLDRHLEKDSGTFPNNLPASLTEFIGRELELKQINMLLNKSRIVTLIGPGGIGKTRLALQVARLRLCDFEDGVFFIPLASVTQPDLVIPSIAKELGIQEIQGRSVLVSLQDNLREKHRLLILDNFEQVTAAAPMLVKLLSAAPLLSILVTSREKLNLSGEHVYMVPPMALPDPGQKLPLGQMAQQAAIALFTSRAQAARFDFVLSEENALIVAELCRQLDGIPLAIELAAANMGELTLPEMLEQSRNRLAWLKNGPCDLPERQQTLRGAIDWSYNLLQEEERRLFAQLGVFTGGFMREAAEAVICPAKTKSISVFEGMTLLTYKCLLRRTPDFGNPDEARFDMLETIREYALEKLSLCGEEKDVRRRHAVYYLTLAEKAEKNLYGREQQNWLERLEKEHSNLRAALLWAKNEGDREIEMRLAGALGPFWDIRGYWSEGLAWLEDILARHCEAVESKMLIKIYHWAGWFLNLQGECEKATNLLKTGLELCQKLDDWAGMAIILYRIGWVFYFQGNFHRAVRKWEQSLAIYREQGEKNGIAMVLRDLGRAAYFFGNYERSEKLCHESLALSRELGCKRGIARALHWLGEVARAKGDYEQSMELFQENLKLCEELEDKFEMANTLFSMAELVRSHRDFEQATYYYQKHISLSRELGYKPGVAYSLLDLGEIARYQGKYGQALSLYQDCLILLQEIGEMGRMTWAYRNMAEVAQHQGDYSKAKELFQKSLSLLREQSHIMLIPLVLEGLAGVALAQNHPTRAARLLGAAENRIKITRAQIAVDDLVEYEERLAATRAKLGEEAFGQAMAEGKSVTLEEIIAYALEEIKFPHQK